MIRGAAPSKLPRAIYPIRAQSKLTAKESSVCAASEGKFVRITGSEHIKGCSIALRAAQASAVRRSQPLSASTSKARSCIRAIRTGSAARNVLAASPKESGSPAARIMRPSSGSWHARSRSAVHTSSDCPGRPKFSSTATALSLYSVRRLRSFRQPHRHRAGQRPDALPSKTSYRKDKPSDAARKRSLNLLLRKSSARA